MTKTQKGINTDCSLIVKGQSCVIKKTGIVLSGDYADDLRLENSILFNTF